MFGLFARVFLCKSYMKVYKIKFIILKQYLHFINCFSQVTYFNKLLYSGLRSNHLTAKEHVKTAFLF